LSRLRNFSALCGVSLILLATTAQPAIAQGDPCAPYADNAPYYQRCQQIHQQSQRIRDEQQRQTQQQLDIREKRLQGFHGQAQQNPATTQAAAPAQASTQGVQTIPIAPATSPAVTATVAPTTQQPSVQATSSAPPMQGAGYIVIDPAKLSTEQLQSILTILKQSAPQATVYTAAPTVVASPAVQAVSAQPTPPTTTGTVLPFTQSYPVIKGKEGKTAIALPDVGQGAQEIMEIEPVDPANLRLQP